MKHIMLAGMAYAMVIIAAAQDTSLQSGWLMPDLNKLTLRQDNITYLPEGGLNLYDQPGGEVVARVGRDPRKQNYPNYELNIFILPRDRSPELVQLTALTPLPQHGYAIPFVKQQSGYVLLFDTEGPYHYWVQVDELKSKSFVITNTWPQTNIQDVVNTETGAGLLVPDFSQHENLPTENYTYIPLKGLPLYDKPNGSRVAQLSRFCPVARYEDGNMRMFVLPDENPNACREVTLTDLHHWSDDTYMIPFYKNENGFVRLFNNDKLGYTWAKIEDINNQHFNLMGWKGYYISRRDTPAYARGNGLNLREAPYTDAVKIITLRGETMQIYITGFEDDFCEGAWCKVKVKVYKENPCTTSQSEEENFEREYEGWIKMIDDSGQPNIYINTKGC